MPQSAQNRPSGGSRVPSGSKIKKPRPALPSDDFAPADPSFSSVFSAPSFRSYRFPLVFSEKPTHRHEKISTTARPTSGKKTDLVSAGPARRQRTEQREIESPLRERPTKTPRPFARLASGQFPRIARENPSRSRNSRPKPPPTGRNSDATGFEQSSQTNCFSSIGRRIGVRPNPDESKPPRCIGPPHNREQSKKIGIRNGWPGKVVWPPLPSNFPSCPAGSRTLFCLSNPTGLCGRFPARPPRRTTRTVNHASPQFPWAIGEKRPGLAPSRVVPHLSPTA